MKKLVLFALMGLVMMGSFTSCKKDKQEKEFKKNIVGKWKTYSADGDLRLTDKKAVWEYFADGTVAITSLEGDSWVCSKSYYYKIEGDKYTFMRDAGSTDIVETATIGSITDSYFTRKDFSIYDNIHFDEHVCERVTVDYSQVIVGLWEGNGMAGSETYGDAKHRWQYKADGSYVYLSKNAEGQWEADPSNYGNIYFVDGNFFGSRWCINGVEYKEFWDIDYCNDTEMRWSALRQKEDGSLFTTTMTLKRVDEDIK